jgi:NitT/TauT family transport system ATP-binding protein
MNELSSQQTSEAEQILPISSEAEQILRIDGIRKVYGGQGQHQTVAISDVSLSVAQSEFVSVVGPSGCGKTTLLKTIAGLLAPSGGEVRFKDKLVTEPPREMAVVFQDYSRSLFPWLTVASNISLPLRGRMKKSESREVVDRMTKAVGLTGFERHYPAQLSGGMQQRVAIARALALEPTVLLLDEPFASVDAQTRVELEDLVLSLRQTFDITTLLVTHDIDESIYMSDRVVVLTRQPSVVRDTLEIDLDWPRHQVDTKVDPRFAELRALVYTEIVAAHDGADAALAAASSK